MALWWHCLFVCLLRCLLVYYMLLIQGSSQPSVYYSLGRHLLCFVSRKPPSVNCFHRVHMECKPVSHWARTEQLSSHQVKTLHQIQFKLRAIWRFSYIMPTPQSYNKNQNITELASQQKGFNQRSSLVQIKLNCAQADLLCSSSWVHSSSFDVGAAPIYYCCFWSYTMHTICNIIYT